MDKFQPYSLDYDTPAQGELLGEVKAGFPSPAEAGVQYHIMAPHLGIFPSMSVDFYVESGAEIRIQGKDYLTKNWKVKSNVKDQKIYQTYFDEVADIFKELQTLELECRKEGLSSDYLKLNKPLDAKIDSIKLKWLKSQKRISGPWMDLMTKAVKVAKAYREKDRLNELSEIWAGVDQEYKNTVKGRLGDSFPYETEVSDLDGNMRTLVEFKGKAMLLYFSSYSCKPCAAAKKELDTIIRSGKSQVEVIGFNLDSEAVWISKGKENPVSWHDFNDLKGSYGFNNRFETQGIPTFVTVSKNGKIMDIWTGYKDGIIAERIKSVL